MNRCFNCLELLNENEEQCPHCGYDNSTVQSESEYLAPGSLLNNESYFVGNAIGKSKLCVTYIAWDKFNSKKVAIKEYFPTEFSTRSQQYNSVTQTSESKAEMFEKGKTKFSEEAEMLFRFREKSEIVNISELFEENGTIYYVMEYINGKTLSEIIQDRGQLSVEETLKIIFPIIDSLLYVHSFGFIHRDISPEHIIIDNSGSPKLIGFSAARYAAFNSCEKNLTVMVKSGYSAPEQYITHGECGTFTDVYSIGATMYKMLTGKTPVDSLKRKSNIVDENIDPLELITQYNCNIGAALENVIFDSMNIFSKKRIQTMRELRERLQNLNNSFEQVDKQEYMPLIEETVLLDEDEYILSRQKTSPSDNNTSEVSAPVTNQQPYNDVSSVVEAPSLKHNNTENKVNAPNENDSQKNKIIIILIAVITILVLLLVGVIIKSKVFDAKAVEETDKTVSTTSNDSKIKEDDTENISSEISSENNGTYKVTIIKETGISTVSGDGTYSSGDVVNLKATPDASYNDISWSGYISKSDSDDDYYSTLSFTMPSEDITLYVSAQKKKEYTVTVITGQGIQSVSNDKTYAEGDLVILNATAKSGYNNIKWSGYKSSTNSFISFTMPSDDVTLMVSASE